MKAEKEFLEIKDWFLGELKKHYLLNRFLVDILEMKVFTSGDDVFENVSISHYEIIFQTNGAVPLRITDLTDIQNRIWDIRRQYRGSSMPAEMLEVIFEPEIEYLESFLRSDLETQLLQKLWDYYLDSYHDYATGEIEDIIYKK